jgi:hypothetical protein
MLVEINDDNTNWEASPNNNQLAFELQVGDKFVVCTKLENEENSLFWVLKCVKRLYMYESKQPLTFDHNFIIEKGDEVMEGRYYKQLGRKETSFVMYVGKGLSYIYSHLVCASKFAMVQVAHK